MIKVLIVDDERIIRSGIRLVVPWDSMGVQEVFEAASAKEALGIIKKEEPDLVITDIQMAEMTGLELIAEIRRLKEETRIIVLTGYDEFDYARQCLRMKVQDFLLKPVDEEVLIKIIKNEIQTISETKERAEKQSHLWRVAGTFEQANLERYMRKLISQKETEETLSFLQNDYHYNIQSPLKIILLLSSFDYGLKREEEGDSLSKLTVKNLIIGYLDANDYGITFEDAKGHLLLCLFKGQSSDENEKQLKTIIQLVKEECGILLKLISGSQVKGFKEVHISYNDALHHLTKTTGDYPVALNEDGKKGQLDMFREVYGEFISKINDNIGDTKQVLRIFKAFCGAADAYSITDRYVRKCCFEIASSLYFSFVIETGDNNRHKLNVLLSSLLSANREENYVITQKFIEELLEIDVEDNEVVSKVKRYILDNLAEDISVAGIATHFYLSPNYFSRLFKRVTGERCNEFIARARMEKAEHLLAATNMKIATVAEEVGYRDTNYFSLSFKKHIGISPGQFRREEREM